MFAFSIFWLIGLAVALAVLFGVFVALRICLFKSKELSQGKVTILKAGVLIAIFLFGFGLFYNPLINYWTLSEVLNIHGSISNVQYAGSDFDGFLLVVDDKGMFMPKSAVELHFQPRMNYDATARITGTTNANGLVVLDEKIPETLSGTYTLKIHAENHRKKRSYATQVEVRSSPLRMYLYSDRKIYKPGHTVHFAGYIWKRSDDSFTPHSFESANISVKNEEGLVIYKKEIKTDDYGQITLDFPLSVTLDEGTYSFEVQAGSITENYDVDVEKYEKPTVNLDISTKSWIVASEMLDIDFLATYLFGEPVSEAYLNLGIYTESRPYQKITETVKLHDGQYKYTFDMDQLYYQTPRDHLIIEGTITDAASGEVQTEEKSVLVVDSGLLLEVSTVLNAYDTGDLVDVKITAQHPDGVPASDVDSKITVTKYYRGQSSVIFSEDKLFSSQYNYVFNYPSDADYLHIMVTGTSGAYSASAKAYINFRPDNYWDCSGRCDFSGMPDKYRKDIVLESDKAEYKPGERAVISVYARSHYANKPVVVTVSTPFGNTLAALNLDDNARGELLLAYEDIAPFAAIQGFVYNNRFIESEPLQVSACADKEIDVKLDFLHSDYKPGDIVDLKIDTGKPNTQVTLGVVDESIMLLKNYEFTPFAALYSFGEAGTQNSIATRNPRNYGNGYLFFSLGMLVLILVSGYALYLKYMKKGKKIHNYQGADKRFLALGVSGIFVIIGTILLAMMDIVEDEDIGFLLFGVGSVMVLISVVERVYGALIKGRGCKWLASLGFAGGMMSALPLLLAVLRLYEPEVEILLSFVIGMIMLLISYLGEGIKYGSQSRIVTVISSIVVFAFLTVFVVGIFLMFYMTTGSMSKLASVETGDSYDDSGMMRSINAPTAMGGRYEEVLAEDSMWKDEGIVPVDIKIRTSFPDTALWIPSLRTDSAGKVKVPVMLPDTVTSWRIEALAATMNAEVGSAKDSVISKMDYFVKAAPPTEVTVGDEITVSMVVFNNLDKAVESRLCVSSSTKRCGVSSSKFRIISGEPVKTVVVPAHSSKSARWRVKFTGYGYANMSFLAYSVDGSVSDGLTKMALVKPKEEIKSAVYSGVVENNEVEFEIFDGAIPEFTSAGLVIQPSLEAVSLDSIEQLAHYPHGCAEQVMSGLYPDIIVKQYLAKSGQLAPGFESELDKMIISGLQKIYGYRHSNGGWGWYKNDQTKVFMCAYVLYGLAEARNAGFFIDDVYISGAQNYLSSVQKSDGSFRGSGHLSKEDMTMTASVAHALLNSGMDEKSSTVKRAMDYLSGKYKAGDMKSPYVIALYALCLEKAGDTSDLPGVLSKLDSMKKADGNNVYWSDDKSTSYYSYSLGGAVTTTATATLALINSGDAQYHDSVQGSVEWLLSRRGSYGWGQTSDTAAVLKTITEYAQLSRDSVDGKISVSLNNAHVGNYDVSENDRAVVYDIGLDYKVGKNILKFSKDGTGTVYYTLNVKQVRLQEDINEKTLGITKKLSRTKVGVGDTLPVTISISCSGDKVYYVVVEDVVPPGFVVDEKSLERAISRSENIVEYELSGNNVYFYIGSLGSETFSYNLKAVNEGIVFAAPAKAYAMYDVENADESESYSVEIA